MMTLEDNGEADSWLYALESLERSQWNTTEYIDHDFWIGMGRTLT